MNSTNLIIFLSFVCTTLGMMTLNYFHAAVENSTRAWTLCKQLNEMAVISRQHEERAAALSQELEHEKECVQVLTTRNNKLEIEKEQLELQNHCLIDLLCNADAKTILSMEKMDGPLVYLQEGTINLN